MRSQVLPFIVTLAAFLIPLNIRAQHAALSVSDGFGIPGSKGNLVQIELDNSAVGEIGAVQLDIRFDTNVLTISDILPTERSDSVGCVYCIFGWNMMSDSTVRIGIVRVRPAIMPDTGSIANIFFEVDEKALPDEYPLVPMDVILADPQGNDVSTVTIEGTFTIVRGNVVQVISASGTPGSEDNEVGLNLYNEVPISQISLTLLFHPRALSLTGVLPTDRTQELKYFDWSTPDSGQAELSIHGSEGQLIPSGSGTIAYFLFTVATEIDSNIYPLHLSDISALDSASIPVEVTLIDGNFSIGIGEIDLLADEHDFGELSLGDTALWSLPIYNGGLADLIVFDVISDRPDFFIVSPPFPAVVQPYRKFSVDVGFVPISIGPKDGTLTVLSNDSDEDTLIVRLFGKAKEPPDIELSVTDIAFGDIQVCTTAERSFELSNTGNGDLIVENLSSDNPTFYVLTPSFPQTITPGSELNVILAFVPGRVDIYTGAIEIKSDDPEESRIVLPVSGNGVMVGEPTLKVGTTYGLFSHTNWIDVSLTNDRPVSQVHFCLNYESRYLTILDALKTPRTAPYSHLSLQELEPGYLTVQLSDDKGLLIGEGFGEILCFGFDVISDEIDSNLSVSLSDVSVLDAFGEEIDFVLENGGFIVVPFGDNHLFVGDAYFDGSLPLMLSNTDNVHSLQADLLFDTTILQVEEIKKTQRSSGMDIFIWTPIEDGIRVAMTGIGHYFKPGVGSIADMVFEWLHSPPICGVDIIIEGVILADPLGIEIPVTVGHGTFTVYGEARLQTGDGSGFPGDIENPIPILLSNTVDVASIEFDLSYDPDVLHISQILPTMRTEHMSLFQWQEVVIGTTRVTISDTIGGMIEAGQGPICEFFFNVASDAMVGEYSLALSHVTLIDSRKTIIPADAVSGSFAVFPGGLRLTIGQASGSPGSSDILVPIILYSRNDEIAAMQFDLVFDTDALQVTGVVKTERTSNMDIFSHSNISHGIRVAATGIGHSVPPGVGPVADVSFKVNDDAVPGMYWLELTDVVLADPLGTEIGVIPEGNWFTVVEATEVESTHASLFPQEFSLGQNYPNPFNPSTTIHYAVPGGGRRTEERDWITSNHTTLIIYNILGQEVRVLVDGYQGPGHFTASWDGRDDRGSEVPCGVYFYRLSVDGGLWSETKRMVLLK